MTERERYQKRKSYFVAYAKANRERRRENARRWRLGLGKEYNVRQAEYNRRYREANGSIPRSARSVARQAITITGETLHERFLAYRKATKRPQVL